MKNKEKILVALASLSFFLVLYFLIASKKIEIPNEKIIKSEEPKEELVKVDLEELKNKYTESVKTIYGDLQEDTREINKEEIDIEKELKSFKKKLITLTVPSEYRVFHLSFIMLIDNVLNNGLAFDERFRNELNKIGEDNPWLK